MTTTANFMKNNMLFWLFPIVLLAVKLIFDLIPYKPLVFCLTFIVVTITALIIKKNRIERNISATKELEEMEFEDEDDYSKYGEKSVEDRKRKLRKEQAKQDRKQSKLKQHNKKEKNPTAKKSDSIDSDVNDNDEQFLRLLKK